MTHRFPIDFSPPVKKLISLGEKGIQGTGPWLNYSDHGITTEYIPELIRIIQEIDSFWFEGNAESDETSAPIHAWRALGQLQSQEAIPALITLIVQNEELKSDWIMEEIPKVMGMIGPVCITILQKYLLDPEPLTWAIISTAHCLAEVGKQNPESRSDCVAALQAGLGNYAKNDKAANGFLISYLADLLSTEAAPLVEHAYQADRVDLSIMGDFEEYQVAVGLLKKRMTPLPRFNLFANIQAEWEAKNKTRLQAQKKKKKRRTGKKKRRGQKEKRK